MVTCNVGLLGDLDEREITVVIRPATQGQITSTVTVSANGADLNSDDNSASAITTVQPSADLAVSVVDSPDPVAVGQDLTYTVTVTNRGPAIATGVTLTDTLPANATYVSSVASQGACSRNGNLVTCNLGNINNGALATVTIVVRPTALGTLNNQAQVTATSMDLVASNNTATSTTQVNSPPTISSIGPRTINEDTALSAVPFTVGDSETPASALVVTAFSSNPLLVPNGNLGVGGSSANRTLTATPLPNQFGTTTISVVVTDTGGATATNSFLLTVMSVNDLPTITDIVNQTIDEDTTLAPVAFVVGDVETAPGSLFVSATSSDTTLVPNANITLTVNGANRTISILPASNRNGTTVITVTVFDGTAANNDTFVLTVRPVNDPPTISSLSNRTVNEDTPTGNISFTISDPETAAGNLILTGTSSNKTLVPDNQIVFGGSGGNRTVNVIPASNESGTTVITLSVRDPEGLSTNATFTLNVTAVNDPPTIDNLVNRIINEDGGQQTINLSGISSGAANEHQTLTVTASSSNPGLIPNPAVSYASPNATGTLTFTPTANLYGSAIITVTVQDGGALNGSTVKTFTVTVVPVNDPPTLNTIADVNLLEDAGAQAVPFNGVSSGASNESQTLNVTATSSDPTIIPHPNVVFQSPNSSGVSSFTPVANAFGTVTITVTVNDQGASNNVATQTFHVTVAPVNDFPTLTALGNVTVDEDSGEDTVNLSGITSGALNENQTLTVTATSGNFGLIPSPTVVYVSPGAAGSLKFTPALNQSGTATITVTVNDNGASNNLVTRNFTVTVNPVNDPPTLNPIADVIIAEDSGTRLVQFNGVSSGAPNESQTLNVTATSSNPAIIPDPAVSYTSPNANGTLSFAPRPNTSGMVTITVTVNDGGTAHNLFSRSFTVTVSNVNDPPTITSVPDQTIDEDTSTAALPVTIGDQETPASALTFIASSSNEELISSQDILLQGSGSNRTVTVRPLTNQFGFATVSLLVFDAGGAYNFTAFNVTVLPVNDLPTISSLADQTVAEGESAGPLALTVSDVETPVGNLTLSGTAANPTLVPSANITFTGSGANRLVTIRPAANQFGVTTVTLRVNDGFDTVGTMFTLTVKGVNVPPTITSLANQTTDEDVPTNPLGFTIGDRETPATDLTLKANSSNPTLIPSSGIVFGGSGSNRTITIKPATNQFGSATIILSVEDNEPVWTSVTNIPNINGNQQYVTVTASKRMQVFRLASTVGAASPPRLSIQPNGSDLRISWPYPASGWVLETARTVGAHNTTKFQVTVNPINDLPVITVPAALAIAEDGATSLLPFTIGDVETPAANLTVAAVSSNPTLVPAGGIAVSGSGSNRTVRVTPAANQFGTVNITLSVTDGEGAKTDAPFAVTVFPVNDAPTLNALVNLTIDEDAPQQTVNLAGITSGAANEAQTLVVIANSSNPALIPTPAVVYTSPNSTGSLRFTPAANANGTATITVTVNDGGTSNNLVTRTFDVTVNSVNDLPTVTSIANQQTLEDTPTADLPFTIGDVETAAANLTVTATSSNTSLIPPSGIVLGGSGSAHTVKLIPAANQFGTAQITIEVTDAQNGKSSTTIQLTVVPVNDPPTLTAPSNFTIQEDAGEQSVTLTGLTPGPANETGPLIVTATNSNSALLTGLTVDYANPATSGTLHFQTVTNANGTATITVTVNDSGASNNLVTRTFTVTVTPVNDLPTISSLADQSTDEDVPTPAMAFTIGDIETAASALTVTGSSSNPVLVPNSAIVLGGTGANRTVTIRPATNQFGTATITLRVEDDEGDIATMDFELTVNSVNDAPVITAPADLIIAEDGATSLLPVTVGDVETSAANLNVSAVSSNPTLVSAGGIALSGSGGNRTVRVTPAANQFGTANITLTVTDGDGAKTDAAFALTVFPVNDVPTLNALGNLIIDEDAPQQTVNLAVITSGAANETQTLVVSANSSNPALIPTPAVVYTSPNSTGSLRFTPQANANGTATITVTVNDGGTSNNIVTRTFDVTVNAINDLPTITGIGNQQTLEDTPTADLPFTIGDVETAAANLTVTATSSNTSLIPQSGIVLSGSGSARTVKLIPAANQFGTAQITLEVTDAQNGKSSTTVQLTVVPVNDPPTLTAPSDLTILEDAGPQSVALTGLTVGPSNEAGPLIVTATNSNSAVLTGLTVDYSNPATSGTLHFQTVTNANGTATITVLVNDSGASNNMVTRSFTVTVTPVNDLPTITAIADQTTDEDVSTPALAFTIGDVETAAGALTVTGSSSNPDLVPPAGIVLGGTSASRTVVIRPATNQFGTTTITLRVEDGDSGSVTTDFELTVNAVNDAPTITQLPDQATDEDSPKAVPFAVTDAETPLNSLVLQATLSDQTLVPNANLTFNGTGANRILTITPTANRHGTTTIHWP